MNRQQFEDKVTADLNNQVLQLTRAFERKLAETAIALTAEERHFLATQLACINTVAYMRGVEVGAFAYAESGNSRSMLAAALTGEGKALEIAEQALPKGVWLPEFPEDEDEPKKHGNVHGCCSMCVGKPVDEHDDDLDGLEDDKPAWVDDIAELCQELLKSVRRIKGGKK